MVTSNSGLLVELEAEIVELERKIPDQATRDRLFAVDRDHALSQWPPPVARRFPSRNKSWQGNLFVGSLKFHYLDRIELQGNKVLKEEKLLEEMKQRIRDVREGPDGLLYVLTDEEKGQLIRLQPAK